jgi:DNA-binding protein H-NS
MATLQELLAQREALDRQIEEVSTKGRAEALEKIRALMTESGLTMADLGGRGSRGAYGSDGKAAKKTPSGKVAAKYRNASSGESWSGRGLKPKWLNAAIAAGKKIEDFAV